MYLRWGLYRFFGVDRWDDPVWPWAFYVRFPFGCEARIGRRL